MSCLNVRLLQLIPLRFPIVVTFRKNSIKTSLFNIAYPLTSVFKKNTMVELVNAAKIFVVQESVYISLQSYKTHLQYSLLNVLWKQ